MVFYLLQSWLRSLSKLKLSIILSLFILFFHNQAKCLEPRELAVIVNELDPQSLSVARYYQKKRQIPFENIIYVAFNPGGANIDSEHFKKIRKVIVANTLDAIKAYAITWTEPYRVDCMSLTAAITFGFSRAYCASDCSATKESPFYGKAFDALQQDAGLPKMSMMLAGMSESAVFKLIDRGLQSNQISSRGKAFLLQSRDSKRNVRAKFYREDFEKTPKTSKITRNYLKANFATGKTDVALYMVGAKTVPYLNRVNFLPGAIGEHLTSAGGMLTDSYQMSVLRWLEAGATASYGAVVEPCNFLEKFSNPNLLLEGLEAGNTLMEVYWRSVKMPGQGIFVGEPLAGFIGGFSSL